MTQSWPAAIGLIILAGVFAVVAVLYAVGVLQFLADSSHHNHYTHAMLFGGLALLSLVAANFARPKA